MSSKPNYFHMQLNAQCYQAAPKSTVSLKSISKVFVKLRLGGFAHKLQVYYTKTQYSRKDKSATNVNSVITKKKKTLSI